MCTLLCRDCSFMIDVRPKSGGMSFVQAVDSLVAEAMIEPGNARREVRRYVLAPAQPLSFLVGKLELMSVRDEAKRRFGDRFNLHDFHAGLLSGGALPITLVRDEMWERARAS